MSNSNLLRAVSYCLSTALLLTVATSADTFAAPPDHAKGKGKILQLESMGARQFAGTTIPMPDDPTNFQACDHGYVDWYIPPNARGNPHVITHGSSIRGFQTTFDGQPGFQSLLLGERFPVYLVDLPRTGRAGRSCPEFTWNPFNPTYSARNVFSRIGVWPPNTPFSEAEFFPGVRFSQDPEVLDQFFRNQYVEFNEPEKVELDTDALAVLLEEVYEEHGKGGIVHTHSSGGVRGFAVARKTDKIGGHIAWEPSVFPPVFPEGELPPPIKRADGVLVPAGTEIPLEEFLKLTTHPILMIWGDNLPINTQVNVEQHKFFAEAVNNHGGNAVVVILPEIGLFGNTHYVYADTNVNQVFAVISHWLREHGLEHDDH
jgi:hypothetical protein